MTRILIDTAVHYDAKLCGHDGPADINHGEDGFRLSVDKGGWFTLNTRDGEVLIDPHTARQAATAILAQHAVMRKAS